VFLITCDGVIDGGSTQIFAGLQADCSDLVSLDRHTKTSSHTVYLYSLLPQCLVKLRFIYICLQGVKVLLYMGEMMSNILN